MTRSPSVTGEPEQYGFDGCVGSFSFVVTPCSQSNSPLARLRHLTIRRSPTACVTNTRSPQTIGVELPGSGREIRHLTFSLVLHFTGRSFSSVMPVPSGPRHAGQF